MIDFINGFGVLLQNILKWALDGILWILKMVPYLVYDGILTVFQLTISALSLPSVLFTAAGEWGLLPPQAVYIINALGIPIGISMILAAIAVRMAINLIPAALTRI